MMPFTLQDILTDSRAATGHLLASRLRSRNTFANFLTPAPIHRAGNSAADSKVHGVYLACGCWDDEH